MKPAFRILLVYVVLVVLSRLWVILTPERIDVPPGMRVIALAEFDTATRVDQSVEIAYQTIGPKTSEAIVLLHGSPGSLQDFSTLGHAIGQGRYVIVPDMAGFGWSQRDVADYSFVAQADYILQLLDRLDVKRAHLVGFSWGGGVAIEIAARAPDRVASLVMVASLGVQEFELLGSFELNRLVHAFQHALFVGLDWGVPHFGLFDRGPFGVGYTRSFLDSDQRRLRPALEGWSGPMLLLHGQNDFLVPANAAREHHRIVPQSRLVWINGGHLVLWRHPGVVANALNSWFSDADHGRLVHRSAAAPGRVAAAGGQFERTLAGPQDGLGWVVFLLLVFAASMVSEDLTCIGVGLLVATGQVGFVSGVVACVVALVVGDLVLYCGGRLIGPHVLRFLGHDPDEVGPIGERLRRKGGMAILLGRFVPGARLPTYVAAGVLSYSVIAFTGYLTLAAVIWAPLIVGLAALGGQAFQMHHATPRTALWAGLLLILAIAIGARVIPQMFTFRGRRLLLARWQRLRHWEFWPIWAIYLPMIPAIAVMAIRYRSLRVVTLVNPPITGGGLAGESKALISCAIEQVPEHAIETAPIESGDPALRCAAVEAFLSDRFLNYPIVLKPDIGERGRDVVIASNAAVVVRYFEKHEGRTLVQEYVPGVEFGIFYVRAPGVRNGKIFSIARKTPRSIIGNGRNTLEHLILSDSICLPMAEKLLFINHDRLKAIPADGECVQLTQLGTHSLGCRFLVGEDLRSKRLEQAIDTLSRAADLDFGRYDVRASSEDALREGSFKVVEFNGLTGEAAHMYDPRYGFAAGLRILRAQWWHAFEVGHGHHVAGRRPLTWKALAELVRAARG